MHGGPGQWSGDTARPVSDQSISYRCLGQCRLRANVVHWRGHGVGNALRWLLLAKQVMGVEQPVGDLGTFFEGAADGRRYALAGLAAQPWRAFDLDTDTAHGAHFIGAGGDVHLDAELIEQAALQVFEVGQALQVFQALEQAVFFLAGQAQNAQVGARRYEQAFALADADTGWAGLAQRYDGLHEAQA